MVENKTLPTKDHRVDPIEATSIRLGYPFDARDVEVMPQFRACSGLAQRQTAGLWGAVRV
jgi:hypothetical protein